MNTAEVIFLIFGSIVFYTYIGYGAILFILVSIKELFRSKNINANYTINKPLDVTLLIAAYNEEEIVLSKMQNCLDLSYPKEYLKIVWVTDGSNDNTIELLKRFSDVTILHVPERKGKTAAINRAIKQIFTPIVVFTDANTMLNKDAINHIVKCFVNPKIGCVAGEKRVVIMGKDTASSFGEGVYWKYESLLKSLDSRLFSAVGAAGELFAIRRDLFEEMENDTLLDDFILSMRIAEKGYRIEYCAEAYAYERGSANINEENKRKIRISAGGLQSVARLRSLFNIFKNPVLSFQYISHRVLRWTITPIAFFLLLPLNLLILMDKNANIIFTFIFCFQVIFYILGIIGKIMANKKLNNKLLFIPYYFLFMNFSVIQGAIYLFSKKKGDGTWEKSSRKN